jgi:hypothetical protein
MHPPRPYRERRLGPLDNAVQSPAKRGGAGDPLPRARRSINEIGHIGMIGRLPLATIS